MKLNKEQISFYECSDEVWITSINESKIDSQKNVRVITFPSHINRKPVKHIYYQFWQSDWPSLQRVVVPRFVGAEPTSSGYDKYPVIEYYDD